MKTFAIRGRCAATPPPQSWREELARMLGARPRRIGTWAELGLYGALTCMAEAGEQALPPDAQIWLGSERGTYAATATVMAQMQDDLPMPLAFLQTQPSQLLALLAAQLGWNGHACFVAGTEPQALLRLAAAQCGAGGLLLGWVDEMQGGATNWLRLLPGGEVAGEGVALAADQLFAPGHTHVRIDGMSLRAFPSGAAILGEQGAR
ncbi:MAG: hypothetical protein KJ795_04510 [Gammaproteobacteria bacterium]|nr:hypothetical protein [Gammaproteobacteria bacterium]MBU1777256.1 hypothetical protein [Gammaproteobacteria bacterium]MBU1968986.1 hypothetical protein [Gammaproteobacteria bacterium]